MRSKKAREQPKHVCEFTKTSKTLDALFPPATKCGKIRRKFRECCLVSEENGRRCYAPQGTAGYFYEKEKQLTQHYYKIHPHSKFRQYWEMAIIVEIFLCLTIRPFIVSQFGRDSLCSPTYQLIAFVVDMIEVVDVCLSFVTGYVDSETRNVALETRKIFFHNFRRVCFVFNLIASLPLEFVVYLYVNKLCPHFSAAYAIFVKILKIGVLSQYIVHMAKIYNWSELCLRTAWTLIMMFLLAHWLSCLFYLMIYVNHFGEPHTLFKTNNNYFFRHITIFYMISSIFFFQNGLLTHLSITTTQDMLFSSLVLIITYLSNVVFVGLFIQLLGLKKTPLIQYEEMIQEVQKFLIQENLPRHVHKKVIKYLQFRFRYRYFPEKMILETLSPPLRQEIANFLCMGLIMHPKSIFADIPRDLASELCLRLKFEIFLDGDVIVRAGKIAKKMYFLYCGSVVAYSPQGKELMHLYEGAQFGEATFATDDRHQVTVIALEMTECYALRYRDFLHCVAHFPDYVDVVTKAANKQRTYLKELIQIMKEP